MPQPLKRHPRLQPLSREHHAGLLLCWKVRKALKANISTARIEAYVRWFFEKMLLPHFKIEESAVFPILGSAHPEVKIALEQHKEILDLFQQDMNNPEILDKIQSTLEKHIRFEERDLFNTIQEFASEEEWAGVTQAHDSLSETCGEWEDEFWN